MMSYQLQIWNTNQTQNSTRILIQTNGEIYYDDARPADWDLGDPIKGMEKAETDGNDIVPENNPEIDRDQDTEILDIFLEEKDNSNSELPGTGDAAAKSIAILDDNIEKYAETSDL